MEKKNSGHGGKRPGAGRKPRGGRTTGVISCVLDKATISELDAIAVNFGETRNSLIKRVLTGFVNKNLLEIK